MARLACKDILPNVSIISSKANDVIVEFTVSSALLPKVEG